MPPPEGKKSNQEGEKPQAKTQEEGKTIEQAMAEVAKELRKNPEAASKMIDKVKLNTRLDTAQRVGEFQQEIRLAMQGDNLSDKYIGRIIDSTLQRQKAEKTMNSLKNVKDALNGVEKVEDLRKLDAKTLTKLEDTYEGILLYTFTDIASQKDRIDFNNWDGYKKITPGARLTVNFLGNNAGEKEIGGADMLPPSVRRITVYKNGDASDARTSDMRVGLKGQNKPGNGFYDERGYIPVLSGDVIEIGGKDRSETNIGVVTDYDLPFRKKPDGTTGPLDEEAYKRYNESEEGKKEQEYLKDLFRRNPNAQRNKQMTLEEIQALKEKIDTSGVGGRIAALALEEAGKAEGEKYVPKHCWDMINYIYRGAGATSRTRVYQDLNYEGKDCGDHHASPEMMNLIAPGDWIYYNNKNTADSHGNHSALVIDYNKETRMAKVASGYAGHPLRIHDVNLNEKPVTHITKPGAFERSQEEFMASLPDVRIDESRSIMDQIRGLNDAQREMAVMIEEEFLAAGLSRSIAAAAVINAKAESRLRAGAIGDSGHSVGLFQLHDRGGGHGMTVEDRADARTNIRTILEREVLRRMGEKLRERAAAGASVSELAAIFSRDIERPRDRNGAMQKRAQMAAQLFGGGSDSQAA